MSLIQKHRDDRNRWSIFIFLEFQKSFQTPSLSSVCLSRREETVFGVPPSHISRLTEASLPLHLSEGKADFIEKPRRTNP